MHSKDFYDLAAFLTGTGPYPEARWRSAISRAYYAAFLDARDRLLSAGTIPIPKNTAHATVWQAYSYGSKPVKVIGRLLKDLKEMREDADYTLTAPIDDDNAREAVSLSAQIRSKLESADITGCVDPRFGPSH